MKNQLKITKALIFLFFVTVVAEASLIYIYNPYDWAPCPNCNSTNTEYWMDDGPDITYQCFNCGAYFYRNSSVFMYNENINKIYNESLRYKNKTLNNSSIT